VITVLMLTKFRFAAAQMAETAGFCEIRDVVLGRSIPYGVAIAAGGWVVGVRLIPASG
jgi:Flp pilus assembly protein protease CpaA